MLLQIGGIMQELVMKVADLKAPERNVRIHTDQQLKEFEKSIRMFGQIRPIVVDENNEILAGNGLYLTLMRLGIEEARVYKYDDLTSAQKKKLMIADNKIFNLGIENMDTLNEFLSELQGDLDIPGYDEDILRQMFADADELTEQISNYGTLDQSRGRKGNRLSAACRTARAGTEHGSAGDCSCGRSGESGDRTFCYLPEVR